MEYRILKFISSLLICQLAGFIGSFFTTPAISSWYKEINKPSFNPPNWLFGPVWIVLFLLMGVSLYLVWNRVSAEKKSKNAIFFFALQLILNIGWSFLFFGLKSPLFGFIEIILLWLAILITMVKFYQIFKTAGWLLLPYLLWVSFAAILNFSIWQLNP